MICFLVQINMDGTGVKMATRSTAVARNGLLYGPCGGRCGNAEVLIFIIYDSSAVKSEIAIRCGRVGQWRLPLCGSCLADSTDNRFDVIATAIKTDISLEAWP